MHPALRSLLALLATVLFAAACGDDDDLEAGNEPSTPIEAPEGSEPEPTEAPTPSVAVTLNEIDVAELTDEWGCGFGFRVSNADQTVALYLQFEDADAARAGNVPAVGNVPSVVWSGRVTTGQDLFANWCDDVLEEGEPTPVVDQEWQLVDGTVTIVGDPPVQSTGELTVELTGLAAETDDGERVELGDITITNTLWGVFGG